MKPRWSSTQTHAIVHSTVVDLAPHRARARDADRTWRLAIVAVLLSATALVIAAAALVVVLRGAM